MINIQINKTIFFYALSLMSLFLLLLILSPAHAKTPAVQQHSEENIQQLLEDIRAAYARVKKANSSNAIVKNNMTTQDKISSEPEPVTTSGPSQPIWKLSLSDVNMKVLTANINIKTSYLTMDDSTQDVIIQEAVFDPNLSFGSSLSRTRTPTAAGTGAAASESIAWDMGLSKRIFTGATVTLDFDHDRTARESRTYSTDLGLTISQPLFKDMGPEITYSSLRISKNNRDISNELLRDQINSQITSAQTIYWNILEAIETLGARKLAFKQASDLLVQNKRELALGKRTLIDVLQAESTSASREEDVIKQENTVEDRFDDIQDIYLWEREMVITEVIAPNFEPIKLELKRCLELASQNRPDYINALKTLSNRIIF